MAQFKIGGKTVVLSKELQLTALPRMEVPVIANFLRDLAVLEDLHNLGILSCTPEDWEETLEVANAFAFEINWRTFSREVGLTLEVR